VALKQQEQLMATVTAPPRVQEQRLRLSCIDWKTYVGMSDLLVDRPIRFTYDRGELEIMVVSPEHDRAKWLLGRLLAALTEELDIDIAGFGSMTFRKEDLDRGMEPDQCFWIQHEPEIRGRTDIDLESDPPPDLVIEIEISRSVIPRLPILAALKVPEVWRWDGQTLRVMLLNESGQYVAASASQALQFVPLAEVARFMKLDPAESETKHMNAFRAWVREQAPGWQRA
jgi:Uma2 family endonuclease